MSLHGRIAARSGGDDEGWMDTFRMLPDSEIDALLSGAPTDSAALVVLSELVSVVRADVMAPPPMSARLRRQIASGSPAPAPHHRARRAVLAGALFGGVAMGVAGAQDALPGPIQDGVAAAAHVFGVDLPRSSDRERPIGDEPSEGAPTEDGSSPGGGSPSPSEGGDPTRTLPEGGPPELTPGGAVPALPADPGTAGEPATPATPAAPAPPTTERGQGGRNPGATTTATVTEEESGEARPKARPSAPPEKRPLATTQSG